MLTHLKKEHDLNKILKHQKKSKEGITLLFTSLWDAPSQRLLQKLENQYGEEPIEGGEPLYVLNSFDMPHSFVIFNTTVTPHLVHIERKSVKSFDYLPYVYRRLGLG